MTEKTYRITIVWPEDGSDSHAREIHRGCTLALEAAAPNTISFRDKDGVRYITTLPYEVMEETKP